MEYDLCATPSGSCSLARQDGQLLLRIRGSRSTADIGRVLLEAQRRTSGLGRLPVQVITDLSGAQQLEAAQARRGA
jgi:hypothetical protein